MSSYCLGERVILVGGLEAGWAGEAGLGVPYCGWVRMPGACRRLGERIAGRERINWVCIMVVIRSILAPCSAFARPPSRPPGIDCSETVNLGGPEIDCSGLTVLQNSQNPEILTVKNPRSVERFSSSLRFERPDLKALSIITVKNAVHKISCRSGHSYYLSPSAKTRGLNRVFWLRQLAL